MLRKIILATLVIGTLIFSSGCSINQSCPVEEVIEDYCCVTYNPYYTHVYPCNFCDQ